MSTEANPSAVYRITDRTPDVATVILDGRILSVVTQWVTDTSGGRDRGPRGIARAWIEVMVRPRRFFRSGVAPGDQAPGLIFAMIVVFFASLVHLALADPDLPVVGTDPTLSTVLVLGLVVLLLTPLTLHLLSALQTLLLIPFARERGGISETVQVLAYATAPCVFAGVPIPEVRVVCTGYAALLLAVGIAERHDVSIGRALALSMVPAALAFGYGFGGFDALATVLSFV